MPGANPFRYRPLSKEADIRLLVLLPAPRFGDSIRVRIEHHERQYHKEHARSVEVWQSPDLLGDARSLRESASDINTSERSETEYEAVSYAWGTDGTTRNVYEISNGIEKTLELRANVAVMLQFLRNESTSRRLWIDAICIDQSNASEKESQVMQMGQIYAEAMRVLIWSGPFSGYSKFDEDALFDLFDGRMTVEEIVSSNSDVAPWAPEHQLFGDIGSFLARDWFHRLWVIQEVAHARDALFICGDRQMKFTNMIRKVANLLQGWQVRTQPLPAGERSMVARNIAMVDLLESNVYNLQQDSMMNLLMEFHTALCSDERDRLYALNSLSRDPVPVNYRQPVEMVYRHYAVREFNRHPTLLLGCAGAFQPKAQEWPSWVPDWGGASLHKPLGQHYDFQSGPIEDALIMDIDEDGTMLIKAFYVGIVRKKLSFDNRDWFLQPQLAFGAPCALVNSWHSTFSKAARSVGLDIDLDTDTTFTDAISLAGEVALMSHEVYDENTSTHEDLCRTRATRMIGRTGFFTGAGEFGIAPRGIREGDLLIRFSTCPIVIALRPRDTGVGLRSPELHPSCTASGHARVMTVVGDCYVPMIARDQETKPGSDLSTWWLH
jgi:hypothetical protein